MFNYGAQYYRPPNPPSEDWSKDLKQMEELGFNTIKYWAMWNHIHLGEEEYDFSEMDELIELAKEHDLKVVISLILENAPHWMANKYPETRFEDQDGNKIDLQARPNTPGGGWPGLCLNNKEVRKHAENFMYKLASRYADEKTVAYYTTWDEAFFEPNYYYPNKTFCYCDACRSQFRDWLQEKYGDLTELNENWETRYTDWSQVKPPRYLGDYPRFLDWLRFRLDNHQRWMKWRAETLRNGDSKVALRAHGIAGNMGGLVWRFNDDWRSATTVQEWGTSTFPHWAVDHPNITREKEEQMIGHHLKLDVARGAAQGREFWQTELQGGHIRSGTTAKDPRGLTRGPNPKPEEMELWNWNAIMAGAKGVLYWQYRPELLGHESPGFGLVHRDGSPTYRTNVANKFAKLFNEYSELKESKPIKSNIALGLLTEGALFSFVAEGDTGQFTETVRGDYRLLWELGFQPDIAKPNQFSEYNAIYLPFPLLLESETAETVKSYVSNGGTLITDGTPSVYDDNGRTLRKSPGKDLDKVTGMRLETTRESESGTLESELGSIPTAARRDVYKCTDGEPVGTWSDGGIGAVENSYEQGKSITLGTLIGLSYEQNRNRITYDFLRELLSSNMIEPLTQTDVSGTKTRLHEIDDGYVLYAINMKGSPKELEVKLEKEVEKVNKEIGAISGKVQENSQKKLDISMNGVSGGAIVLKGE